MTTYNTPHFATGVSDRNLRPEPTTSRARPASAAPYRTAGVSNEAAMLADGPTPDWQPGAAKGGVPKVAIGALGAALVGGAALAIVLLAPSNKVVKPVTPDPIATASAQNTAAQKSVDSSTAAVNELDKNPPAAGNTAAATDAATTDTRTTTATTTTKVDTTPALAVPAPVKAVIPHEAPVANAPVAREHHAKATVATPRAVPQQQAAPAVSPEAPAVTPPAPVQAPAMQQTPDNPTVTPAPTPAPTPDTPAPTPAPAPTE
jgi:hypothetical protein